MEERAPPGALALGYAGLIPFWALAVGAAVPGPLGVLSVQAYAVYAAAILAFLGGVRWGAEIAQTPQASAARLACSVLPSLAGWAIALFAIVGPRLAGPGGVFAAVFAAMLLWDRAGAKAGLLPPWYGRLRIPLSLGVIGSGLALAGAQVWVRAQS